MAASIRILIRFSLFLLLATMFFGMLSSFAFLYPELSNRYLPFYQLRPMHVSAALFWLLSGAAASVLHFKKEAFNDHKDNPEEKGFIFSWIATILVIFVFYSFRKFGGREYWEFPPLLCIPLLGSWLVLMLAYFRSWRKRKPNPPLYVWMWSTGIVFFLITFLEQNLYQIPWFRESFLREITVQWKSNGSMVGAWNQMLYGTSILLMVRLSGNEEVARAKLSWLFYFIGLTNLMFNWGHHIYNVPGAAWIRDVAYAISMTEWVVLVIIIRGFRKRLKKERRYRHLLSYRFLITSEFWVLLNLSLALLMSIPSINRYTHGTHITVAHAMGATIGINSMILLAAFGYMLQVDKLPETGKKFIRIGWVITQVSLLIFWLSLIAAGIVKAYRDVALNMTVFREMMQPVMQILTVTAFAGVGLFTGMAMIAFAYLKALRKLKLRTLRLTALLDKRKETDRHYGQIIHKKRSVSV